jgi:hypothetical protein
MTPNPSLASFGTTSGTVATRFSPGKISFGTPITWGMTLSLRTVDTRFYFGRRARPAIGYSFRGKSP